MSLRDHDVNTLAVWLSPEFMIPAARYYGLDIVRNVLPELLEDVIENPNMLAVIGAEQAYKDVRGMIRSYLSFVRQRDKVGQNLELAQALRVMGYAGNFQRVVPMNLTDWRRSASKIWSQPAPTPGCIRLKVDDSLTGKMGAFLVQTVSQMMIDRPELNRSFMQGRVWIRETPHVMVTTRVGEDKVSSFVIDGSKGTLKEVHERMYAAAKKAIKAERHELSFLASSLMDRWAESGVITSSASAMVSDVGGLGVPEGMSALAGFNGLPIGFTIGELVKGVVPIWANLDHRCFDGSHCGTIYRYLRESLEKFQGVK